MLSITLFIAALLAVGATLSATFFKKKYFWRYLRAGAISFAVMAVAAFVTELVASSSFALLGFWGMGLFITTLAFALAVLSDDGDPTMSGGVGFGLALIVLTLVLGSVYIIWPYSDSENRQLEALAKVQVVPAPPSLSSLSPEEVPSGVDRWSALSIARASLAERAPEGWITAERSAYQRVKGEPRYVFEVVSEGPETKTAISELPAIGYVTVDAENPKAVADVRLFYGAQWRMEGASQLRKQVFNHSSRLWPLEFTNDFVFEIDDTGRPYYVAGLERPTVRLGGETPVGAVTIDALTGKVSRYQMADIPAWVEHVYSAANVHERLGGWGRRNGGFTLGLPSEGKAVQSVVTAEGPAWRSLLVSGSDGQFVRYIAITSTRTGATRLYTPPSNHSVDGLAIIERQTEGVVAEVLPPEDGLTTFFLAGDPNPYRGGIKGREGVFPRVLPGQKVQVTYYTGHGLRRAVSLQVHTAAE